MSENGELGDQEKEENAIKYAKKYMNPHEELQALGIDPLSEEYQRRLDDRIDRFGEQSSSTAPNKQNLLALFESLEVKPPSSFFLTDNLGSTDLSGNINTNVAEANKNDNKNGNIRFEAIHLRGVDEMSTTDIFTYFNEFPPNFVEWVDDSSCNIVYSDALNACRALLCKSKPNNDGADGNHGDKENKKEENNKENDDESKMEVDIKRELDKPVGQKWRLGDAYTKFSKLMMRFATSRDQKKGGRAHESKFYEKYGNPSEKIWTKNFKHKKNNKMEDGDGFTKGSSDDYEKTTSVDGEKKNVKDRLGSRSRPDIRVRVSRSRSLSPNRSRERRARSGSEEKYNSKIRSRNALEKVDWTNDEMTSFDRHIKEELESRRKKTNRSGYQKRHYDDDDDDDDGDDDGDDDDDGPFDYNDAAYQPARVTKGGVKSRLGEVKRCKVEDGLNDGFDKREIRGRVRGYDDKFGNIEKTSIHGRNDDYENDKRNEEFVDDGKSTSKKNKSSVFNRLGQRF